jgi:uncharacterized protein (DUF433 family)
MEQSGKTYINSDPEILLGKPVIKGTRISIEHIVSLYEMGWAEEMILENYSSLQKEHLRAVFNYLKECLKVEMFFPPKSRVA